jgi:hypothetical protein
MTYIINIVLFAAFTQVFAADKETFVSIEAAAQEEAESSGKHYYEPQDPVTTRSAPDWQDDPGAYEFVATISGAVILYNGVQLGEAGDLFAAFDDDGNVRGLSQPSQLIIPTFGPYEGRNN